MIKFYDAKGREHTARAGQVLPAGTMIQDGREWLTLSEDGTVVPVMYEGNPYDEGSRPSRIGWAVQTASTLAAGAAKKAAANAEAAEAARLTGIVKETVGAEWFVSKPYGDAKGWHACGIGLTPFADEAALLALLPRLKAAQDFADARDCKAPELVAADGSDYREQGDPRHPGKHDGQKAAREWAEDAYRSGDSWSDD